MKKILLILLSMINILLANEANKLMIVNNEEYFIVNEDLSKCTKVVPYEGKVENLMGGILVLDKKASDCTPEEISFLKG